MMLISTANIVVKSTRKRKNVIITLDDCSALTPTHVGSMSWMVHG